MDRKINIRFTGYLSSSSVFAGGVAGEGVKRPSGGGCGRGYPAQGSFCILGTQSKRSHNSVGIIVWNIGKLSIHK